MIIQPKELATRSINRRRGPMSFWACTISCPQQFKTLDTESFGEYVGKLILGWDKLNLQLLPKGGVKPLSIHSTTNAVRVRLPFIRLWEIEWFPYPVYERFPRPGRLFHVFCWAELFGTEDWKKESSFACLSPFVLPDCCAWVNLFSS